MPQPKKEPDAIDREIIVYVRTGEPKGPKTINQIADYLAWKKGISLENSQVRTRIDWIITRNHLSEPEIYKGYVRKNAVPTSRKKGRPSKGKYLRNMHELPYPLRRP